MHTDAYVHAYAPTHTHAHAHAQTYAELNTQCPSTDTLIRTQKQRHRRLCTCTSTWCNPQVLRVEEVQSHSIGVSATSPKRRKHINAIWVTSAAQCRSSRRSRSNINARDSYRTYQRSLTSDKQPHPGSCKAGMRTSISVVRERRLRQYLRQ